MRLSLGNRALALVAINLVLLAGAAWAQSGRIAGTVKDVAGEGLGGVTVVIAETGAATLTGDDGSFGFDGVPAGSYTLEFSLGDYSATETGVTVTAAESRTVDKVVDWDVSFAETITVFSASRRQERIVDAPAAVTVVPQQEIEREAAAGQVPKLLEFTPGVDVAQSGIYDFNLNTRGFNSSLNRRVVTLIDGRDPSVPFLGSQEWAAMSTPMDDLASAELVRGPSSALYGANAYNGVFNLVTKAPRDSQGGVIRLTGGELSTTNADLRWAGAMGANWFGKLVGGYHASGDFTRSRNVTTEYPGLTRERIPLVIEDDDEIQFVALRADRYFGNSFLTTEAGYTDLQGPAFQTGIGRVQLTDVTREWGRVNFTAPRWNLLGTYNRRDADDQIALQTGAALFLDDQNWGLELQGNGSFASGRARVVGGITYAEEEVDSANRAGVQTLLFEPVESDTQAAYAQLDFDFTDRVKAVIAGRVDESSLHDTQVSPKGSLVVGLAANHTLRFTYNEAFQVPNYSEFFLRAPTALPGTTISSFNLSAIENAFRPFLGTTQLGFSFIPVLALGNKDLEVEEVKSYEVGYSGILGGKAYVTIDYYQSELENFVTDLLGNANPVLGRLNPNFQAYAPPAAVPAPVAAQILATLRANLPAAVFASMSNAPNGAPIIALASYTNLGKVDTQGVDFGLNFYVNDNWTLDASYSWFDFDIKQDIPGDPIKANAPENTFKAGITLNQGPWNFSLKGRTVDSFEWFVGSLFRGVVPSYEVFDFAGGYRINESWGVGVDVSNLLDDEHFETFGGDVLGRRALGYVTFNW
jgi:iron complex outermembrane receptor protein